MGVPGSDVAHLSDLAGSAADGLVDRLAGSPGWTQRFEILDEVLVGWLEDRHEPRTEVSRAWERLVASAGALEVSTLASEVGYSRRHLSELFRRELGLAPKVAARVLRFERSRRLLSRPGGNSLGEVAATAGYFDQSHMDHDWTEIAGCPPSVWMTEELPFVQDEGVHENTSSDHDRYNDQSQRLADASLS